MLTQQPSIGVITNVQNKRFKRSRRTKPRKRFLVLCLFLIMFSIALSAIGYRILDNRYREDIAIAHAGAGELGAGISLLRALPHDPFNTKAVSEARQDFGDALAAFSRLNGDVNLIPDVFTSLPAAGSLLGSAKRLAPLALGVAQAGFAACTIISTLTTGLHNSMQKATGLTTADLVVLDQNFQQIKMALTSAAGLVNQLQPADLQLDPSLGKLVGEFHTYLPLIQQGVEEATTLFPALPQLLGIGQPAYYLIEILDSTELRPGGGFIGNYGIATLGGGLVTSAKVIDTYLLDQSSASKRRVSFPPAYGWFPFSLTWGWGLRDSNLDADFPTSARNGEMLYKLEGGTLPLAGVIAITPQLMEQILTLTGPIAIPEYHETVTAQNLIDRIHYHQLIEEKASGVNPVPSADGYSSVRKHFTALLGQYVLARLHSLSTSLLPGLLGILINSLHSKDLQIYFNAQGAEKLLQDYHVDDSVQSSGDGLFVVDANITPSKADQYLVTTVNDQVAIDQSGAAEHRTVINFSWTRPGLTGSDFYGSTIYRGFIRVYAPAGSILQTQSGWSPYSTGIAFGSRFWGGYVSLDYPLGGAITLTWSVAGVAQKDGHSWQYLYLMQRQAGAQQKMYLQIALPPCAAIAQTSAGIVTNGKRQAFLAQTLSQNTAVSINYTCSG